MLCCTRPKTRDSEFQANGWQLATVASARPDCADNMHKPPCSSSPKQDSPDLSDMEPANPAGISIPGLETFCAPRNLCDDGKIAGEACTSESIVVLGMSMPHHAKPSHGALDTPPQSLANSHSHTSKQLGSSSVNALASAARVPAWPVRPVRPATLVHRPHSCDVASAMWPGGTLPTLDAEDDATAAAAAQMLCAEFGGVDFGDRQPSPPRLRRAATGARVDRSLPIEILPPTLSLMHNSLPGKAGFSRAGISEFRETLHVTANAHPHYANTIRARLGQNQLQMRRWQPRAPTDNAMLSTAPTMWRRHTQEHVLNPSPPGGLGAGAVAAIGPAVIVGAAGGAHGWPRVIANSSDDCLGEGLAAQQQAPAMDGNTHRANHTNSDWAWSSSSLSAGVQAEAESMTAGQGRHTSSDGPTESMQVCDDGGPASPPLSLATGPDYGMCQPPPLPPPAVHSRATRGLGCGLALRPTLNKPRSRLACSSNSRVPSGLTDTTPHTWGPTTGGTAVVEPLLMCTMPEAGLHHGLMGYSGPAMMEGSATHAAMMRTAPELLAAGFGGSHRSAGQCVTTLEYEFDELVRSEEFNRLLRHELAVDSNDVEVSSEGLTLCGGF